MSNTNDDPTDVLVVRVLKAQEQLAHLTEQYDGDVSDAEWLRRVAALRTTLAGLYLAASHNHDVNTVEWHALREASLSHEMLAASNRAAADQYDETTRNGAA